MDWDQQVSQESLKTAFDKIASQKEGGVKYNNINMCFYILYAKICGLLMSSKEKVF